jgi:hypothetical protein
MTELNVPSDLADTLRATADRRNMAIIQYRRYGERDADGANLMNANVAWYGAVDRLFWLLIDEIQRNEIRGHGARPARVETP